jgi:hypothetical protein
MNLIIFIWRTLLGLLPGSLQAVPARAATDAQPATDFTVAWLRWRRAEASCGWMQLAPVHVSGAWPPSGQRGGGLIRACAARESLWNLNALHRSAQRDGRLRPLASILS